MGRAFGGKVTGSFLAAGGRDPGDKDGGIFSVFHLEASAPLSGTLDTSRGPVDGRTGPKRPHWERNPVPGPTPEERERGMPRQPGRPASRPAQPPASGRSGVRRRGRAGPGGGGRGLGRGCGRNNRGAGCVFTKDSGEAAELPLSTDSWASWVGGELVMEWFFVSH